MIDGRVVADWLMDDLVVVVIGHSLTQCLVCWGVAELDGGTGYDVEVGQWWFFSLRDHRREGDSRL